MGRKKTIPEPSESAVRESLKDFFEDLPTSLIRINDVINDYHAIIPEKQRISKGIVYVIKTLAPLYIKVFDEMKVDLKETSRAIFEMLYDKEELHNVYGIIVFSLCNYAKDNPEEIYTLIEEVAKHPNWCVRDFVHLAIRQILEENKERFSKQFIVWTKSEDENIRRLVSEALRPVAENKWIAENPGYSLKILDELVRDNSEYVQVSLSNNISDLSKNNPELVMSKMRIWLRNNNKNTYSICYNGCKNLIKKNKAAVFELLRIDQYKYKSKVYK